MLLLKGLGGTDKIILKGMSFFAHHGATEAERAAGQTFKVDAEVYAAFSQAAATDDLAKTVDYDEIYKQIRAVMLDNRFCLLETLADKLAARILSNQLVEKVVLRVKKLEPPIAGQIDSVAVEVCRGR